MVMTESEFLEKVETTLNKVEILIDNILETTDRDIECTRSGNLMEINSIQNSRKVIISVQSSMQELWIASKHGGFHYRIRGDQWINTRDNSEFFNALTTLIG